MGRMIAVRTYAGYRAARVEYDRDDLLAALERHWSTTMSVHGLVAQGDMLAIGEKGVMRVINRGVTRTAETLAELVGISSSESVHCLSVFDETMITYDQFAEWNMTCEDGKDLLLENITDAGPWHHLIAGKKVKQAFQKVA